MSTERTAAAAFTDWINSFPIDPKISSISELGDGTVICKLLLDIDRRYFAEDVARITPSSQWIIRFQNLKKVYKLFSQYYSMTLGLRLPTSSENVPNLSAIAKDGSRPEIIKFARLLINAAVQSERKADYIVKIQALNPSSQTELMMAINQMMNIEEDDNVEDDSFTTDQDTSRTMETDFRMEEEISQLIADKDATEKEYKKLNDRFTRLQKNHDDLQSEVAVLQEQLERSRGGDGSTGRHDPLLRSQMDQLQTDVHKLEDLLSERDATITQLENAAKAANRKIEELTKATDTIEKLKDELDTSRHTIEKLKKEQNVMQHYRKKLESMPELEKRLGYLEVENQALQKELTQAEDCLKQGAGEKKLVITYRKQIERLEADMSELVKEKQKLELEHAAWKEKIDGDETQRAKDTELIQSLEWKIRELETGVIGSASQAVNRDLESEITFNTVTKADLKMQIDKLERENRTLKASSAVTAEDIVLQNLLDDEERAKSRLENELLQLHGDKLALEAEVANLRSGSSAENSELLTRLQANISDRDKIIENMRTQQRNMEEKLLEKNRDLAEAQSDLRLIGKEGDGDLTSSRSAEAVSLRTELEDVKSQRRFAQDELETYRSQLNKALLNNDDLQKKNAEQKDALLEWERTNSDLKASVAALSGSAEGKEGELAKIVSQLQEKLEQRREKMAKSREHIKKLNNTIKDLEEKLSKAESDITDALVKSIQQEKKDMQTDYNRRMERLRKENDLMASAWYDITSRLQSNSTTLGRRKDAPTSWLNKQRATLECLPKKSTV